MSLRELNEKEQKALALTIVQGCLGYAQENEENFEELLNGDVLPNHPTADFSDVVCYNIKLLVDEGYLLGDVELMYDEEESDGDETKGIIAGLSTFSIKGITDKGKVFMKNGEFGVKTMEFKEKAVPIIKGIGSEIIVAAILKVLGL